MDKASNIKSEIIGGITTFVAMSYIVIVNPGILASPGTGMSFSGVLTATVLLCFSMTLLMGIYAKLPYGVAPGMGINAFFAYSLVIGRGIPWEIALGIFFWAGIIFLLCSLTSVRIRIVRAIPVQLRHGAAIGIGIFIAFIGLKNAGIIRSDPTTFVKLGHFGLTQFISIITLFFAVYLLKRKSPVAFLFPIILAALVGIVLGLVQFPSQVLSIPDFDSVFLKSIFWEHSSFLFCL